MRNEPAATVAERLCRPETPEEHAAVARIMAAKRDHREGRLSDDDLHRIKAEAIASLPALQTR